MYAAAGGAERRRPLPHLLGGLVGERDGADVVRLDAGLDQARDAVRDDAGLAAARARRGPASGPSRWQTACRCDGVSCCRSASSMTEVQPSKCGRVDMWKRGSLAGFHASDTSTRHFSLRLCLLLLLDLLTQLLSGLLQLLEKLRLLDLDAGQQTLPDVQRIGLTVQELTDREPSSTPAWGQVNSLGVAVFWRCSNPRPPGPIARWRRRASSSRDGVQTVGVDQERHDLLARVL